MGLLLDTHVLIWFLEGNYALPANTRGLISNPENGVFVSIASLWEIAIKVSIGKLVLANSLADVTRLVAAMNIGIVGVNQKHVLFVSSLPFHHRDPFDRMIVSQAIVEEFNLVSRDQHFDSYLTNRRIERIW